MSTVCILLTLSGALFYIVSFSIISVFRPMSITNEGTADYIFPIFTCNISGIFLFKSRECFLHRIKTMLFHHKVISSFSPLIISISCYLTVRLMSNKAQEPAAATVRQEAWETAEKTNTSQKISEGQKTEIIRIINTIKLIPRKLRQLAWSR